MLHISRRVNVDEVSALSHVDDKGRRSLWTNPYGKPRGPFEAWDWRIGCSGGWRTTIGAWWAVSSLNCNGGQKLR